MHDLPTRQISRLPSGLHLATSSTLIIYRHLLTNPSYPHPPTDHPLPPPCHSPTLLTFSVLFATVLFRHSLNSP
ncbi:hypothetical protein BaRGS_00033733 [Batillaria attramentaria]|uniref:Uncharacterized protein n=1 Tax=Batillaria attramentaria TaxID=370345 RepID=A0ABD0JKQ6_9CAEN